MSDEPPLWAGRPGGRSLDVLGIGQCSLDHVCTVQGLPAFAQKEPMLAYERLPGGQTATALLAAARLGASAALVSSTGADEAARRVLEPLRAAGIDLGGVREVPGAPTQLAVILVDRASGERTVLWHRDPRLRLRAEDVPEARIRAARCLLLDGGDPEVGARAARVARRAGVPVVLDIDTVVPGVEALLAEVDFPIVSSQFAETFSRDGTVRGGLGRLLELGAKLAVSTLGERGCLARSEDREVASPAFRITPRDTTGAGDVFHAAFVWGLLEGYGVERLLRSANAAAALSCRALGAQGGLPARGELEAFLSDQKPGPWRDPDRAGGGR
ncbi:MAG: PfkB family carbohydrate kinase [Myxococcota bacterium]|nr:PfkB family carbohydrate kinase [Myxococcota bacterium]